MRKEKREGQRGRKMDDEKRKLLCGKKGGGEGGEVGKEERVRSVGRGNEGSGRTLMKTLVLPICQSWSPSTLLQMRREVILKSVTSAIVNPGISTR